MKINKKIAIIMTILIIASIFVVQNNSLDMYGHEEQNILDICFFNNENFNILVEKTTSVGIQITRWNRNIFLNLNEIIILTSILNVDDILKLKNFGNISKTFLLCSYSVFVVYFVNKKDGKKPKLGLIS